jgi:hypothetical protein
MEMIDILLQVIVATVIRGWYSHEGNRTYNESNKIQRVKTMREGINGASRIMSDLALRKILYHLAGLQSAKNLVDLWYEIPEHMRKDIARGKLLDGWVHAIVPTHLDHEIKRIIGEQKQS